MSVDKKPRRDPILHKLVGEDEEVCLWDNEKKCHVRTAGNFPSDTLVLEKACPMCPTYKEMMKGEG